MGFPDRSTRNELGSFDRIGPNEVSSKWLVSTYAFGGPRTPEIGDTGGGGWLNVLKKEAS
jgi:hypothetical protein